MTKHAERRRRLRVEELETRRVLTSLFESGGNLAGLSANDDVDLGDLNGDGYLDAFVTHRGTGSEVWLNNGDGTFTDSGQSLGSYQDIYAVLGDVDGDGDMDAVVASYNFSTSASQSHVVVWENDGLGYFTLADEITAGSAVDVALADIDDDGDLDLFVAQARPEHKNLVFRNNGLGDFVNTSQSLGNEESKSVEFGDIDNDGDEDAAIGVKNGPSEFWLNDGNGIFSLGQTVGTATDQHLALGDIDGDGDLDAIGTGQGAIWKNDGTGTFSAGNQSIAQAATATSHLALGDADLDGDLDVFLANWGQADKVLLNDGSGIFTEADLFDEKQVVWGARANVVTAFDMENGNVLRQFEVPFDVLGIAQVGDTLMLATIPPYDPPATVATVIRETDLSGNLIPSPVIDGPVTIDGPVAAFDVLDNGNLVIARFFDGTISILDPSGAFLSSFSAAGDSATGCTGAPEFTGISADSDEIHVIDFCGIVRSFDLDGIQTARNETMINSGLFFGLTTTETGYFTSHFSIFPPYLFNEESLHQVNWGSSLNTHSGAEPFYRFTSDCPDSPSDCRVESLDAGHISTLGLFEPQVSSHVALGDLDNDGDLDAIVATFDSAETNPIWINTSNPVDPNTDGDLICDLDLDSDCDPDDLEILYDDIPSNHPADYDGSGTVDSDDILEWLLSASSPLNAANNSGAFYNLGDVNLDGSVGSTDLGILLNNFGATAASSGTGVGWGGGDLDRNGTVGSPDLGQLLNRFGFNTPTTAATIASATPAISSTDIPSGETDGFPTEWAFTLDEEDEDEETV